MKSRVALLAATLVAVLSAPAFADQCPMMIERIDAVTAGARLSPARMSELRRLRDEGRMLHVQGKHQQAMEKLTEAAGILGLR